jgi:hypothetical protein
VKTNPARKTTTWATSEPVGLWAHTALASEGQLWQLTSSSSIGSACQYAIDTEGRLWVTVPNEALPELESRFVQTYLQHTLLYLLD